MNPTTLEIDNNEELNTKIQIWLEFGEIVYDKDLKTTIPMHDMDLDCGADTFEEAIIELGKLCKEKGYKIHEYKNISENSIKELEELYQNQK